MADEDNVNKLNEEEKNDEGTPTSLFTLKRPKVSK